MILTDPTVKIVRTTFELPEDLHTDFKMTLLRERKTMQDFLEQVIRAYVQRARLEDE